MTDKTAHHTVTFADPPNLATIELLARAAYPRNDDDDSSDLQIDAQNLFFIAVERAHCLTASLETYCLKATANEAIDEALRVVRRRFAGGMPEKIATLQEDVCDLMHTLEDRIEYLRGRGAWGKASLLADRVTHLARLVAFLDHASQSDELEQSRMLFDGATLAEVLADTDFADWARD